MAHSKNRVIGVNGRIPWDIPNDRKIFKSLTKDKILIIGRRTFEEEPNQCHIDHTKHSIIVSTTMDKPQIPIANSNACSAEVPSHKLHVSKSLDEALHLANNLSGSGNGEAAEISRLVCWVAGGERLYEESLKHPSAEELHLSEVDLEVDVSNDNGKIHDISFFPARYRWDNVFKLVSSHEYPEIADEDFHTPGFTYNVYKRLRRQR